MLPAGGAEVNLQNGGRGISTPGGRRTGVCPVRDWGRLARRGKGAGPPLGEGSMVSQRGGAGG